MYGARFAVKHEYRFFHSLTVLYPLLFLRILCTLVEIKHVYRKVDDIVKNLEARKFGSVTSGLSELFWVRLSEVFYSQHIFGRGRIKLG